MVLKSGPVVEEVSLVNTLLHYARQEVHMLLGTFYKGGKGGYRKGQIWKIGFLSEDRIQELCFLFEQYPP